jgi:hypothetical protein
MAKKLTTGERIRRYMETHPHAKPKQIAEALDVSLTYVHTLRSIDKRKIAEGKPIRRIKRPYEKKVAQSSESLWQPPALVPMPEPQAPETDAKNILTHIGTFTSSKSISSKIDNVNSPAHYKVGGVETIDFIEAKKLGYNLGNVVKYITRADHKGNQYEDLCKARWYLNREISKHLGVDNQ